MDIEKIVEEIRQYAKENDCNPQEAFSVYFDQWDEIKRAVAEKMFGDN